MSSGSEKKLTEKGRTKNIIDARHNLMMKQVLYSRTVPDETLKEEGSASIFSFQKGVAQTYRNEFFPSSIGIRQDRNVNTRKSAFQGLRQIELTEKSTSNDHIQNLKAALQSH